MTITGKLAITSIIVSLQKHRILSLLTSSNTEDESVFNETGNEKKNNSTSRVTMKDREISLEGSLLLLGTRLPEFLVAVLTPRLAFTTATWIGSWWITFLLVLTPSVNWV